MIVVRGGCSVRRRTSQLETRWYQRISRIFLRHHWSSASTFLASTLDRAQHSDPYNINGKMQTLLWWWNVLERFGWPGAWHDIRLLSHSQDKGRQPIVFFNLLDSLCCHVGPDIKHHVPDRVKPSFVIFDIWALWRSWPECPDVKNYKWWLNSVWHRMLYSCIRMATVAVNELNVQTLNDCSFDIINCVIILLSMLCSCPTVLINNWGHSYGRREILTVISFWHENCFVVMLFCCGIG